MSREQEDRPYAVVAGGEVNGLGVVRALARESVPTIVLDTDPTRPTMRTRHGEKLQVASLGGARFVEELLRLRPRFAQKPVLILTQEAGVAAVSADYAKIAGAYRITMPPHDTMRMLMDKLQFQTRAEELGFAVPKALTLRAGADLAALEALRYPVILKPAVKDPRYEKRFAKAYRLADAPAVRAQWAQMTEVIDEAIVQEWIEGGDGDVYFTLQYRRAQGAAVSFTGRKTCQWPPLVGGTASCIPAPEAEAELTETTSRFFVAVGFVGLGSMEYKRDRRDGRFYMVEPTVGRTDYQEEIATLNGINLPYAAWRGECGLEPRAQERATVQNGWRDPFGHHNAKVAGATDAADGLGLKMADAYFRWDDPAPYLAARLGPKLKRLASAVPRKAPAG